MICEKDVLRAAVEPGGAYWAGAWLTCVRQRTGAGVAVDAVHTGALVEAGA